MLCNNTEKWLYKLPHNFVWKSPFTQDKDWAFQDKNGTTWLKLLRDGRIVIMQDYSWDGCTPKVCFLDILFGTPDGAVDSTTGKPKTYYASLVHDALCQFQPADLPLSRAQIDKCFFLLMQETNFTLRYIYYAAVRMFGWFTQPVTRKIRHIQGGLRVESIQEE